MSETPEARLAALGLALPSVPAPLAAYVPAVRTGGYVYTAGQLPMVDGKLLMTGKVGAQVSTAEAAALARTATLICSTGQRAVPCGGPCSKVAPW